MLLFSETILKNDCRYNEIMKFKFNFVIKDLENLVLCSNFIKDKKNDPDRSGSFLISIAFSIRSKTDH